MSKYYDDPLVVAYMAREHRVYTYQGSEAGGDYIVNDPASFFHFLKDELPKSINTTEKQRYYIHEDSLPIFEPKHGDWGRGKAGQMCCYVDDELKWYVPQDGVYIEAADIVTRRPKLQFFTPLEE